MVFVGNICEVNTSKSLVKVNYQGTISKFIPYLAVANSFKRKFTPPRNGEQVLMFQGENGNAKFALGSIFSRNNKEPDGASATKEICEYEDGAIISYDTSNSTLEILAPKTINIVVSNDINVTCKNANLTTQNTVIKSPSVRILGDTTINGTISTAGGSGGSGEFAINGNLNVSGSITAGGNASFGGSVIDGRGDLSNHTNNGSARD